MDCEWRRFLSVFWFPVTIDVQFSREESSESSLVLVRWSHFSFCWFVWSCVKFSKTLSERLIDEFPKCNSPDFDTSSYEPFFSLVPDEVNRLEECGQDIEDNENCFKQNTLSDEYGLSEYEKYHWGTIQTPGGGKVSPPLYNTLTENKISGCICDPENNEKMIFNSYPQGHPRWSCQSQR